MNKEEINKIQRILNKHTIFINYETHKNIYHYLHNHIYYTCYTLEPDFIPPLFFYYLYKNSLKI
jgi:hypothetical protein